jgi:4-amino-4-deoxy-L-arabinose transferase-like glycosyltransferase
VDPWHDYLALPVAPLILIVQAASLFARRRSVRWFLGIACTTAIAAMLAYVSSLPTRPEEGVNIGAGVLVLWLLASIALLVIGVVREGVGALVRHTTKPS